MIEAQNMAGSRAGNPMRRVLRQRNLPICSSARPPELLGRIMSLIFFANIGLAPLSQAVAGALSRYTLDGIFIDAGVALLCVVGWLATQPFVRIIDQEINEPPARA